MNAHNEDAAPMIPGAPPSAERAAPATKRPWITPHCEELPLLTGFLLQQGSGIPGGGGGGGTVFGI
jgi:hypothetical protein